MCYSVELTDQEAKMVNESTTNVLSKIKDAIFNQAVVSDFMAREGLTLGIVVTLYWLARWTNDWIDDEMLKKIEEDERKEKTGLGDVKEEENESGSSDEDKKEK